MIYAPILKLIAERFRQGKNIIILEIGVGRKGFSTKAFLEGMAYRKLNGLGEGKVKLYSIDINKNADGTNRRIEVIPERIAEIVGVRNDWEFIDGDSKEQNWNKKIDILFIDGDHSYEGVKTDFEKYEPFVKKGGMIFMHDVYNKSFGVYKYWKEINYPKVTLSLDRTGLGMVQKV